MSLDDQKYQKRATAYKLNINDILTGEYITNDFGSYLKLFNLQVKRARIMATVIEKREYEAGENPDLTDSSERGGYSFLVLDDGTGTIRMKTWKKDIEKGIDR